MSPTNRHLLALFSTGFVAILALAIAWSWATRNPADLSLRALGEAAGRGYIFGYPLILMDETRASVLRDAGVRSNRLHHVRTLPAAGDTTVVRPNTDTLYSLAWLDLADGPQVLHVPPMPGRYWLFQGLDAWTNVFADPGIRTAGSAGGRFLFAGPDWNGPVPDGATLYRSPTRMAWLLGRIEIDGPEDLRPVQTLQDAVRLAPLDAARTQMIPARRPFDGDLPPPGRLRAMEPRTVFRRLAALMAENPPAAEDTPALNLLAKINVEPADAPDWSGFGPLALAAMAKGVETARSRLADASPGESGWTTPEPHIGSYGTDYAYRAGVARYGLGANLPEDALYPSTQTDASGASLEGGGVYRLRFEAGELPPVNGFWSITLYNAAGYLVANPAERYTLSSRDSLVVDDDGAVTLDIHPGPPAPGREANWLPAPPEASFNLLGRLYWPRQRALSGKWTMPPVVRVD